MGRMNDGRVRPGRPEKEPVCEISRFLAPALAGKADRRARRQRRAGPSQMGMGWVMGKEAQVTDSVSYKGVRQGRQAAVRRTPGWLGPFHSESR